MKRPPKTKIDAAVKAARLYDGSLDLRVRDQHRLYKRMMTAVRTVEDWGHANGYAVDTVLNQIAQEARRRGLIKPQLAKDI